MPRKIFYHLLNWRLALTVLAALAIFILPFKDSFPYRQAVLEPFGHPLFYSWGNFDGVHYLGIAKQGYFADFTQAFFPLFPLTLRWLNLALGNLLISGLIISHLSFYLALLILYRLVCFDFSKTIAHRTLIFLLLFPTSFFFASIYSESLFLLLVVASFYFMRTQHQSAAILFAALATSTRLVGIFILPALILEKHHQLKKSKKHPTQLLPYLPILLSALGLLLYMYFLHQHYSDALYFLHAQPAFGAQRSADRLILLYQVIYRYLRMITTVSPFSVLFYTVAQEFLLSVIFITLSLISFKKLRPSYALFSILSLITPTLTGTFSSMPRYILTAFPLFILLGSLKPSLLTRTIITGSAILLAANTILFTRGYWIS